MAIIENKVINSFELSVETVEFSVVVLPLMIGMDEFGEAVRVELAYTVYTSVSSVVGAVCSIIAESRLILTRTVRQISD